MSCFGHRRWAQRLAAGCFLALLAAASSVQAEAAWFLVGGVDHPTVLQPLGGGRALVCGEGECAVWDASSGWTSTGYVAFPTENLSYLRRADGNVVAVDGAGGRASQLWSPATGRWTAAAPLPESLKFVRTVELADGRIVAGGLASSVQRPRAYVADAGLRAWSILVDAPPGVGSGAFLVPTVSGALLFAGEIVWRHTSGTEGWSIVSLVDAAPPRFSQQFDWGDDVLLVMQRHDKRETVLVGVDGRLRPALSLPYANDGFGLLPIATASGAKMWLVLVGASALLWRRSGEALIPLPPQALRPFFMTVALDDQRLLGLGASGAVMELALDGGAPPGSPCDGLLRYLSRPQQPILPMSELDLVSASCRDAARRGEAPALLALVRGWVKRPDRADTGRAFECALQDDAVIRVLPQWFAGEKTGYSRAVCYQSLGTWPAAEGAWKTALDHGVYLMGDRWWVDAPLYSLAGNTTSEVRDRLVPALLAANRHRAAGFDTLRDAVCVPDPTTSVARSQACAELASQHEEDWRRQDTLEADRQQKQGSSAHVLRAFAASVVFAGAVTAAYATRYEDAGRAIPTAAGALGGATAGFAVVATSALRGNWVSKSGNELAPAMAGGIVVGGILGGLGAYAATRSAGSRAPATAVALAFPYILTLAGTFD